MENKFLFTFSLKILKKCLISNEKNIFWLRILRKKSMIFSHIVFLGHLIYICQKGTHKDLKAHL